MKLKECGKCEHSIDTRTDFVLYTHNDEIEHSVVDGDRVVVCPGDG